MDARVGGVVVEGALNSAQDAGTRRFLHKPELGTLPHLLSGGIAGAFSKTCTAPLARLTILLQIQGMHSEVAVLSKASIWHEASRVINEEGFRAFWKGNLVTVAHRLPYSAVNFYVYERYKKVVAVIVRIIHIIFYIQGYVKELMSSYFHPTFYALQFFRTMLGENYRGNASADLGIHFVGGGLAGITAASATYPLDLVRTRLAAQRNTIYYRGVWHAFHTICRDEGFIGLYKGLGATLLGVGPSLAISFSVYDSLRSYWQSKRPNDSPIMISLASGSLSGFASSTATFPLDLVRRRMQLEGVGGRARVYNTGLFGTFGHIIRNEGLRGLYRGILPEYYKVVPGVGIIFMTYEALKILLSNIR